MWAADRFNPFSSPSAVGRRYQGGSAERKSEQYQKNFYPSLSIFVTFKALGLTELWFNVICHKAKNVSALMLHYPRIKNARALFFPDDSAIAGTWQS